MKGVCALGAGLVATIASSASAAVFTNWSTSYTINGNGDYVWSVFANFDVAGLVMLNCFDHAKLYESGSMGAIHNDNYTDPDAGVFGSWSPAATNAGLNSGDSYVTVTGSYGGGATGTALDPSFNDEVGNTIVQPGGWYDASPGTANVMGQSFKVAQIVRSASAGDYTAYLKMGFKVANTTQALFGSGNYTLTGVPAPGALALLGVAGLCGRRRRA